MTLHGILMHYPLQEGGRMRGPWYGFCQKAADYNRYDYSDKFDSRADDSP